MSATPTLKPHSMRITPARPSLLARLARLLPHNHPDALRNALGNGGRADPQRVAQMMPKG